MNRDFIYSGSPAHIVFGEGKSAAAGEWVEKLGCSRALVLSTPQQKADAEALAERLGSLPSASLPVPSCIRLSMSPKTAMEVVAETQGRLRRFARRRLDNRARQGDRLSHRPAADRHSDDLCRLGSDADPRPDGGRAQDDGARCQHPARSGDLRSRADHGPAGRHERDVGAERHGPCRRGALCAGPQPDLLADGGRGLARLQGQPAGYRSRRRKRSMLRADALYGAWLCGTVLGTVGMALHHKICHTLGGTFDTPHADTHAIMLPHTAAYNAVAVPELLAPVAEIFGGSVGGGLWDFAKSIGAPLALQGSGPHRSRSRSRGRDRHRKSLLESAADRPAIDSCSAAGCLGGQAAA